MFLESEGFPIEKINFFRCRHKFHFGGDGESWCHWVMEMPMCISGAYGHAQVFLLKGETPMLCGRPIIESLGVVMDFQQRLVRLRSGPWRDATIGLHGEYLLPLWEPEQPMDFSRSLDLEFDLRLAPAGEVDPMSITLADFEKEESAFALMDDSTTDGLQVEPEPGECLLPRHHLRTCDELLQSESHQYHAYVTEELHKPARRRVIWEVYAGRGRVSSIAESLGAEVEVFSLDSGWDFDQPDHRRQFLERLDSEIPDEVWLSPTCKLWSRMQNLAARSPEQQEQLCELREWHHAVHLQFCRRIFERQVANGCHCHLEQPKDALSWRTTALMKLPGFRAEFDACAYGAQCLDADGIWKPTRKATAVQTTKRAMFLELQRKCDGSHQHCPLEGSAPGVGLRTRFMENYQPGLAGVIAAAMMTDETPSVMDFAGAVNEERQHVGEIIKLLANNRQDAVRTIQRLHRNLGHPDNNSLVELLASRGASDVVIDVAKNFNCAACSRYRKPNAASPSTVPTATKFNEVIQADVMWIKVNDQKIPILHVIDLASKFQEATVVNGEKSADFIKALERRWFRIFGIPRQLTTDEGRGWASDDMKEFLADLGITHNMAPGEAHTRLGAVERRHQMLRKAVEIFLDDRGLSSKEGIKTALSYVIPQMNSMCTVAGFSPAQWVLGYQPQFSGDLLTEELAPSQLGGSQTFEEILSLRTSAKMALVRADEDQRLRRALLRRYAGTNVTLQPGQQCWYWRDARASDLVKIRWLGPARVILREDQADGKPFQYWLSHGSQLLRCAPHHVRPDFRQAADTLVGDIAEARKSVLELKSRGVTRFLDLNRANKRNIEEVMSDEEEMGDDDDGQPPRHRPRLEPFTPSTPGPAGGLDLDLQPQPGDVPPGNPTEYTPTTPADSATGLPALNDDEGDGGDEQMPPPPTLPTHNPISTTPMDVFGDETEPSQEPSRPPSGPPSLVLEPPTSGAAPVPTRFPELDSPVAAPTAAPAPYLDPATAALYEPAGSEDFAARRRRFQRQETAIFGRMPNPLRGGDRSEPYPEQKPPKSDEDINFSQAFAVQDVETDQLPKGWTFDESTGYFQLTDKVNDFWEVKAGCLRRHHVTPRRSTVDVSKFADVPIDLQYLDPVRITVMKSPDGSVNILNDDGTQQKSTHHSWTGLSIFQITGAARKELCMYANQPAKKLGREARTKMMRQQTKGRKTVTEKNLTADEKALFQEAKCRELMSFFEHEVWTFDTASNADSARTLTARMLLSWSKHPDGSPRAKARLIVRGYNDYDALTTGLDTSSPTTSRLSRNMLLSMAVNLGWKEWTADISTAFLQGLPQQRKLWVKLPSECLKLLGASEDCRMLLFKPCYGQLDAPRRWYLEATRRLTELKLVPHLLDPCTFLIFEDSFPEVPHEKLGVGEGGLVGMICIHVDDLLGAGLETSAVYQHVIATLKEAFSFREWKTGTDLEYCGATIKRTDDVLSLKHGQYLQRIKPMTLGKHVGPEKTLSSSELTALRGLMGSLSWPAVQSSPHLQASTSMLAGDVSKGLASTVFEANKLLKFAKTNADVGLTFAPLGPMSDWRLVTAFDASFCSRADGTSQGGYFVLLAPKGILETGEDVYHILDWRSFKLPRVARSSLAAESQAAGCASDATEFACRYFEHLLKPQLKLAELLQVKSSLQPTMVTDAKSVYDSYHRESMSSVDKRSGLEIRVVKEQLQSLGGQLRWVSSERQLADGLTKMSTRQSLADRLRHGKVKFLYDPAYTAAKKKPLSERQAEINSSSKPLPTAETKMSKLSKIPEENAVSENLEVTENDLAFESNEPHVYADFPEEEEVPAEECYAQNEGVIKYVNAASHGVSSFDATHLLKYVFKTLLCWNVFVPVAGATDMCFTSGEEITATGANNNLLWSLVMIFLVFAILALCCWIRRLRIQVRSMQTSWNELNHRFNAMIVVHEQLQQSFERRTLGYNRARQLYVEMRNSAIEHQRALQIATQDLGAGYQAIADLQTHFRTCPQGEEVFTQVNSDVWHLDDECDEIYTSGHEIRVLRPCAICNRQNLREVDVDAEPNRHFDGQGVRVVDAPPGMTF